MEATISSLSNAIATQAQKNEQLTMSLREQEKALGAKVQELFQNKWDFLNAVCHEYIETETPESAKERLMKKFEKEMKSLQSPENLRKIEAIVNQYLGDLCSRLRKECPHLKEEEYALFALLASGMTYKSAAWILGVRLKALYTRRDRLAARIAEEDPRDLSAYLSKLKRTH